MPFAEDQSVSPRVTPEMLHPASMDAANAYGVIIDGQPGPTWFNYQVQLCVTPKNTWIACWTQGGYESNPDQRVVVGRRDRDRGLGAELPRAGLDRLVRRAAHRPRLLCSTGTTSTACRGAAWTRPEVLRLCPGGPGNDIEGETEGLRQHLDICEIRRIFSTQLGL